jgi:hypothetical protein
MAKADLVSDHMSTDFSVFNIEPDGTEPGLDQVKLQLQSDGHRYGVFVREVEDGSRMAVKLFDAETSRFSDLKTGPDTWLGDLLNTKEILRKISSTKAPGIIIVKAGEIVGVLGAEILRTFFDRLGVTVHTRLLGDWNLHGKVPKVEAYKIQCARAGCGALNIVSEFAEGKTKCVSGHILEVKSK